MALRFLLLLFVAHVAATDEEPFIGVNIGTALSDMPHPAQVVAQAKVE